ncbi:MAG: hypothetical protein H6710_11360 [Myxococcales bacterium]|nr:hypothetical protein [Myxococcales bacterium]MCB9702397.1 hypothetical protein [Myxococcales bacterium]
MVSPGDLAAHVESTFLGEVVGACEECLTTGAIVGDDGGWPRGIPPQLVAGRAIAALTRAPALAGARVEVRDAGRIRSSGPCVVGEPLVAWAEVRALSRWQPGLAYLTLDVSVRRPQGRELVAFELVLEVEAAEVDAA